MDKFEDITDEQLDFLRDKNLPDYLISITVAYRRDPDHPNDVDYATSEGIGYWYDHGRTSPFKVILNPMWVEQSSHFDVTKMLVYAKIGSNIHCSNIDTLNNYLIKQKLSKFLSE